MRSSNTPDMRLSALVSAKALSALMGKPDGKDKVLATIQYACMFLAAGSSGNALQLQKALASSRKPFRLYKPVDQLMPILHGKHMSPINKIKAIAMALYFGGDHIVWAGSVGLIKNKELVEKVQKVSLYGWLVGSVCTLLSEARALSRKYDPSRLKELDEAAQLELKRKAMSVAQAAAQTTLCLGMLKYFNAKPRTLGFLGLTSSALSVALMLTTPPRAAPTASKQA
mmetsp:Transcript_10567/g.38843  ORF Transcript_10567/g.38843 Transcript_10567/m.38843 type:complete len:227 (+) Transcript_10567:103-783(+)